MMTMTLTTILFLLLRAVHVLFAAVWLGMTAFVGIFLMPSMQEAGPGAGPVMAGIMRRKFPVVMASLGGTVVLTGIYLYWRFTGGFDPALSSSRSAMVFGTGGTAGLLAFIIGGSMVARNAKKMAELSAKLPSMPEGPERAAVASQVEAARARVKKFTPIVLVLQMIALAAMAIGHYV